MFCLSVSYVFYLVYLTTMNVWKQESVGHRTLTSFWFGKEKDKNSSSVVSNFRERRASKKRKKGSLSAHISEFLADRATSARRSFAVSFAGVVSGFVLKKERREEEKRKIVTDNR